MPSREAYIAYLARSGYSESDVAPLLDANEHSELLAVIPAALAAKGQAPEGMLEYLKVVMEGLTPGAGRPKNLNDLLEGMHDGLRRHYSLSDPVFVGASPKNAFDGEAVAVGDGCLILICTGTFQLIEAATTLLEARRAPELKAQQLRAAVDAYVKEGALPSNGQFVGSWAEFNAERRAYFTQLTSSAEVFVILHEYGHIAHGLQFGRADDELAADGWAASQIVARRYQLAEAGVFLFLGLGVLVEECDQATGRSIAHTHPGARNRLAQAAIKLGDRLTASDRAVVVEFLTLVDLATAGWSTGQPGARAIFETGADYFDESEVMRLLESGSCGKGLVVASKAGSRGQENDQNDLPAGLSRTQLDGVYRFVLPSGHGLEMVRVPAGALLYGPSLDPGYPSFEDTRIRSDAASSVECEHDYFIGRYPVLVGEYLDYCHAIGKAPPLRATWQLGDRYPVVNVSLDDAEGFCRWTGLALPNEIEWEKAVRGTDGRILPWRKEWGDEGHRKASAPPEAIPHDETASPFGVQHSLGGVWEMTSDWLKTTNPGAAHYRVLRGGSYASDPSARTVLARHRVTSRSFLREEIGFRVVLRVPKAAPPKDWRDEVLATPPRPTEPEPTPLVVPTEEERGDATRLFEACRQPIGPKQIAIVREIVSRRRRAVHWRDDKGYTALLLLTTAAGLPMFEGSVEIARNLVENGADVNAQTREGATSFHALACRAQWFALDVARVLLATGQADLTVRDKRGETAEMAAKRWVHVYGENYLAMLHAVRGRHAH